MRAAQCDKWERKKILIEQHSVPASVGERGHLSVSWARAVRRLCVQGVDELVGWRCASWPGR